MAWTTIIIIRSVSNMIDKENTFHPIRSVELTEDEKLEQRLYQIPEKDYKAKKFLKGLLVAALLGGVGYFFVEALIEFIRTAIEVLV